jgi:hypothetical protein
MSDLVDRLKTRASIRRGISTRKSVQNNEPDRIADLLEEAAEYIHQLELHIHLRNQVQPAHNSTWDKYENVDRQGGSFSQSEIDEANANNW